jgi:hypothetical protein
MNNLLLSCKNDKSILFNCIQENFQEGKDF